MHRVEARLQPAGEARHQLGRGVDVEEVDHLAAGDAVDQVADGPAEYQAEPEQHAAVGLLGPGQEQRDQQHRGHGHRGQQQQAPRIAELREHPEQPARVA